MEALTKKLDELFTYLSTNMVTKTELKEVRDEIMEEFETLDKRLEEIESRLKGAHDRIDGIADMVRPIEQLVPLITKDFYKRFREVEEKVKHL